MTAIEAYYASLPSTSDPYYAGDFAEFETDENPLFSAANEEQYNEEFYKWF